MRTEPDLPARGATGRNGRRRVGPRRAWWTRARVLAALRAFYRAHGEAPTSTEAWHALVDRSFDRESRGPARAYPSSYAVLRHFPSFRRAWAAAGVGVGRRDEPWSADDDWYLQEAAGIYTRVEIASHLGRTPDAVHRRLYDLGLHTWRRWGLTPHRVERVAHLPAHVLRRYMDQGELPYFRGSRCLYLDPADLPVVEELDWRCLPPELEATVRRALRERLVRQLEAHVAGTDWRAGSLHAPQPVRRTDRRWGPRLLRPTPEPVELEPGVRVRCLRPVPGRPGLTGRAGVVRLVYWSANRTAHNPTRPTTEPAWMARVEFPRLRKHGNDRPRVTYSLPVDALERIGAAEPDVPHQE